MSAAAWSLAAYLDNWRRLAVAGRLRDGFPILEGGGYRSCLACDRELKTPGERAYGLHDGCRREWQRRTSRHAEPAT